jgi:hypothetical protein
MVKKEDEEVVKEEVVRAVVKDCKTFEEMGVVFKEGKCDSCRGNSCFNTATLKATGEEYSVHISTDDAKSEFKIHAYTSANTDAQDDIEEYFVDEADAVKFVCDTFGGFKCW